MRALRHISLPLVLLALAPLVVVILQTILMKFPTVRFLGTLYSPWPTVLALGLLIALVLGGLLALLRRAASNTRNTPVRVLISAAGVVLIGLSVLAAEMVVVNEWVAAQVRSEGLVLNLINQAPSLPSQIAVIPIGLVALVWGAGAVIWLWRAG